MPFVESCVRMRSANATEETREKCRTGWKKSALRPGYVDACIKYAFARKGDESKRECKDGWMREMYEYIDACERFTLLSARNPRAEGLAACVIENSEVLKVKPLNAIFRNGQCA